jgi:hypothetical protein
MGYSSDQPLVTNQLAISVDFPKDTELLVTEITDTYKKIANVVNTKVGGLFNPSEVATYKLLASATPEQQNRNVYRKLFDLVDLNAGNIGAGATVAFPHNINGLVNTMVIYASCTSTDPIYFTVVYPDVYLDATNVNFTNPLGVALTQAIVIAEYVKSL